MNKKTRRIFLFAMVVLLLMPLLVSCQEGKSEEPPLSLRELPQLASFPTGRLLTRTERDPLETQKAADVSDAISSALNNQNNAGKPHIYPQEEPYCLTNRKDLSDYNSLESLDDIYVDEQQKIVAFFALIGSHTESPNSMSPILAINSEETDPSALMYTEIDQRVLSDALLNLGAVTSTTYSSNDGSAFTVYLQTKPDETLQPLSYLLADNEVLPPPTKVYLNIKSAVLDPSLTLIPNNNIPNELTFFYPECELLKNGLTESWHWKDPELLQEGSTVLLCLQMEEK
ncbi:MAG: hypothetical protein Q4E09_05095 [Eubacteriales bacterium]|nr:hypothetical protein [Eubacteriales bacterium]